MLKFCQNNEGTVALPWNKIQWQLTASHHDWNCVHIPQTRNSTITDLGIKHPKTYWDMTYLKKKNINEAIRQKLSKKDVYKLDTHKIYNLIVG